MVRRGGYKFEKGGTVENERIDQYYKQQRYCLCAGDPNSWWLYNELEKLTIEANNKFSI